MISARPLENGSFFFMDQFVREGNCHFLGNQYGDLSFFLLFGINQARVFGQKLLSKMANKTVIDIHCLIDP